MALPGVNFITSHAASFFLNSTGVVYRISSSVNDGAGGLTNTRIAHQTIRCALERSSGAKNDAVEGEAPTNQQLYDLIYEAGVELLATDEVEINSLRYAINGSVNALTNEATRRTAVKLITQPDDVDETPGESDFPDELDTF